MRHGNTGYKAKSYKGQIFVPAYSLKTHIAHIFLYKTITSKYISAELAFTQHTAVSAMLCQQVLKKLIKEEKRDAAPQSPEIPIYLPVKGSCIFVQCVIQWSQIGGGGWWGGVQLTATILGTWELTAWEENVTERKSN